MSGDVRERLSEDAVRRLLHERDVLVGHGADPFEIADAVLDHEDRFRADQLLLRMLFSLLADPFDGICRDLCERNRMLLDPQRLAEAAVADLIGSTFLGAREKPLADWAPKLIEGTCGMFAHEPELFLWQPDEDGSTESVLVHEACGVVNAQPRETRELIWLSWVEAKEAGEIERLTGIHPERQEAILDQVLSTAYARMTGHDPSARGGVPGAEGEAEEAGDG